MQQRPAVRARGVSRFFDDVVALDQVDLDVAAGQIHGLIGPNGAGKTTLLGLLLGLATPDRGELEILGTRVDGRRLGRRRGEAPALPDGVAGFVDSPGLYPSLTPRQNLLALTRLRGADPAPVGDVLAQVGLAEVADEPIRGFSLGMRQRAGLAAALLTRPRLLVLDEPANGLDPAGSREIHAVLTALAAAGTAVVLSSHRMDDLAAFCSEVSVLAAGRVVFTGPIDKLEIECGELAYRLRSSDLDTARRIASETPGIEEPSTSEPTSRSDTLGLRGSEPAIEDLVVRLVRAGVGIRELAPVTAPLEAAFIALTDANRSEALG